MNAKPLAAELASPPICGIVLPKNAAPSTIGVPTIETMIEAGATCLCITAGKTLMFDRDQMIRIAEKNKISILATG